jgi:arylsulfatase A-like enzyme
MIDGAVWCACALSLVGKAAERAPPNVILIITDDQGYGDVGAHGNTLLKTPHLDALHAQSVRLTNFHVDPTCSPTRSALMTGRYSTRTGVWHTIAGRSLMNPRETTLAELFSAAGYDTAQFGKWHLGDNYPLRAQDQGFRVTLHHGGGGVTQTPDFWGNDYFDDTYSQQDGTTRAVEGYCTDVWFREALSFIEAEREGPFFCYLATNAPHAPYFVAEEWKQPYLAAGVAEPMASFYGMIANIDANIGRLVARLDETGLAENTVLIFMTDNGTAAGVARNPKPGEWPGFNAGMRGQKGSPYDGGHRVPFFIRWPVGGIGGGRDIEGLTAHIDVLPTLAELCGIDPPRDVWLDGISLAGALRDATATIPERTLFVHSQRIERPEKWRQSAVMTGRWRLVNGEELFDVRIDPGQQQDVAVTKPDVVAELRSAYEGWWTSLSPALDEEVRIVLGSAVQNPTMLTCHDWHAEEVPWNQQSVSRDPAVNGYWNVEVEQGGRYAVTLRTRPEGVSHPLSAARARVRVGEREAESAVEPGASTVRLTIELPIGPSRMQTWLEAADGKERGAYFVTVERLEQ